MLPRADDPTYEPAFVQALLEAAIPEMRPGRVAALARGWDCDVFVVDDTHVVRMARNLSAAAGLTREASVLPSLAARLPLPVPLPVHLGAIPGEAALCFGVYRLLPGTALCETSGSVGDEDVLARDLGHFLRALHAEALVPEVPPETLGRLDPSRRSAQVREALSQLEWEGGLARAHRVRLVRALDEAEGCALAPAEVLVHGDLHRCNVLIAQGRCSGVIDWIDLHRGHPAVDLAAAFTTVGRSSRAALLEAYGPVAPETVQWARWRAITMLSLAVVGALTRGDGTMAHTCVGMLRDISAA